MVDCQVFGLKPWGHHLTSVLIHAVNAVLVFLALRKLTGATWRSLCVAAIFGLHPLRVESVAWVAERKDVLSTLFALLTLWAYAQYVEEFEVRSPKSKVFYGMALVTFALGLMSKPMLVTLPFVMLLLDFWPLTRFRRLELSASVQAQTNQFSSPNSSTPKLPNSQTPRSTFLRLVLEKLPFFLLSAASCGVTFIAQHRGGAMFIMAGQTLAARAENAAVSYCRYLGKIFWPANLSVIYPVVGHWPAPAVIAAVFLLAVISIRAFTLRTMHPFLLTGWLWFAGTLVPVLGLVAVGEQSMAERYTYFPSIGLLVALVWEAESLARRWHHRVMAGCIVAGVLAVACGVVTRHNLGFWRDSETLFRQAIRSAGDNYVARVCLGNGLLEKGRVDEALWNLHDAARLRPDSPEVHTDLGVALAQKGLLNESVNQFQEAIRLKPDHGLAHFNLGIALEQQGKLGDSIREYEEAGKLNPDFAVVHLNLGVVLLKSGRLEEACAQFQETLRLDPDNATARHNLDVARRLMGR
jgi:Tfp pilus assembly protein PilF